MRLDDEPELNTFDVDRRLEATSRRTADRAREVSRQIDVVADVPDIDEAGAAGIHVPGCIGHGRAVFVPAAQVVELERRTERSPELAAGPASRRTDIGTQPVQLRNGRLDVGQAKREVRQEPRQLAAQRGGNGDGCAG